jgi:hypothetical protein
MVFYTLSGIALLVGTRSLSDHHPLTDEAISAAAAVVQRATSLIAGRQPTVLGRSVSRVG